MTSAFPGTSICRGRVRARTHLKGLVSDPHRHLVKTCPQCGSAYGADDKFCPRDGTALRAPAGADLVGSVIADRYHVLRHIGAGGMGQVYLAEHIKMGRKCAIKVMSPAMAQDPEAVGRFNREAASASGISHPNVAAIYDFGETADGVLYLAMEYVDGEPLTKMLEREGSLAPLRVAELVRQIADALAVAHEMGIVHRDLKPDNVMVARARDGRDLVKVVDFGIAKTQRSGERLTRTGLVVGTPEFMSPEQLSGDPVDSRSDVYALALVAFNMLTGALPFPAASTQETLLMRLTDRPRTLAEMRADIGWPPALQAVLDRALERTPAQRYLSATKFATDLAHALSAVETGALGATLPIERPSSGRSAAGAIADARPARRRSRKPLVLAAAIAGAALAVAAVTLARTIPTAARSRTAGGDRTLALAEPVSGNGARHGGVSRAARSTATRTGPRLAPPDRRGDTTIKGQPGSRPAEDVGEIVRSGVDAGRLNPAVASWLRDALRNRARSSRDTSFVLQRLGESLVAQGRLEEGCAILRVLGDRAPARARERVTARCR